ncbi:polysaccharide biosynthesis/export family protein [Richelia sinica]|uniref:polysaccharide biosynthesis/export family protein n=1 Tax=Richelia sinica TaxID=1357545 RepID=UPI001681D75E|nr:polysaccharide biosynthesis/export family protein [Richelia sinica]MBD2667068.1 polysaccharide biosynthesis/export family protein [Richelia sinica FACHB-800]
MFTIYNSHMRAFSALCLITLQVGVYSITSIPTVVAQTTTSPNQLPGELPAPPSNVDFTSPNNQEETSPQFDRYLLDTGDTISVSVQRPPGPYRLGMGDSINVNVQRFPDLSFQAVINLEGNIVVPLLGIITLKGLTIPEAEAKVRASIDRYVINPIVTLSLAAPRPDLSFQGNVDPDGNVLIPQVGKISIKGLSVDEAQEKIRLALNTIAPEQLVQVSLAGMRPVQITVTGEVFRPGIYTAPSVMPRVTDIIPLVGGSTLTADLRQVQVRRKRPDGEIITQTVDLYGALQGGSSPPNLRLQDGDAVFFPRREVGSDDGYDRNLIARSTLAVPQIRVRILNYAAGGIGVQSLPNGSTFIDALSGVSLEAANLRDIALVRFDPEQGKAITQRLDAKKALAGDASQNVALQDNDVIVVGRSLIGKVTNLLNTITQPFFNVQGFLRFFQNFGNGIFGGNSNN